MAVLDAQSERTTVAYLDYLDSLVETLMFIPPEAQNYAAAQSMIQEVAAFRSHILAIRRNSDDGESLWRNTKALLDDLANLPHFQDANDGGKLVEWLEQLRQYKDGEWSEPQTIQERNEAIAKVNQLIGKLSANEDDYRNRAVQMRSGDAQERRDRAQQILDCTMNALGIGGIVGSAMIWGPKAVAKAGARTVARFIPGIGWVLLGLDVLFLVLCIW
jgi:hypothetical protein